MIRLLFWTNLVICITTVLVHATNEHILHPTILESFSGLRHHREKNINNNDEGADSSLKKEAFHSKMSGLFGLEHKTLASAKVIGIQETEPKQHVGT
eukprot:scaffold60496_cov59-Attheya_sp.AAC.4